MSFRTGGATYRDRATLLRAEASEAADDLDAAIDRLLTADPQDIAAEAQAADYEAAEVLAAGQGWLG